MATEDQAPERRVERGVDLDTWFEALDSMRLPCLEDVYEVLEGVVMWRDDVQEPA